MNKFNFLFGFLKNATNSQDIPQLTNFLKNNETFKAACWKAVSFKKDILRKLDEEVGHVDPELKKKKGDKKIGKK